MKPMPNEIKRRLVFKEPTGDSAEYPILKKVMYDAKQCGSCDRNVAQERFESSILNDHNNIPYWRHKCKNCHKWRNPKTGEFDLNIHELNRIRRFLDEE